MYVCMYEISDIIYIIAQFRIPGHTGASCVKPIKVRLMRGRNESMRALELVKHGCCALNCTISTQKPRNMRNFRDWQMLDVFQSLRTTQIIAFSRYERTHPNFISAAGIEIFGLQIGRPSKFLQGLWASFLCPLGTKRG